MRTVPGASGPCGGGSGAGAILPVSPSVLLRNRSLRGTDDPKRSKTVAADRPTTGILLQSDPCGARRLSARSGLLELAVEESSKQSIRCRVVAGGTIRAHKGMNLPGVSVSAPAFGEKDREDLAFGLSHGVEYVGLSFVRGPEDVTKAREWMEKY